MGAMPSALRAQVALIALLGVLLIPIGTSSLRGLTHILTCQESAATPFTIQVPEDGPPVDPVVLDRRSNARRRASPTSPCAAGSRSTSSIGSDAEDRADVTLAITNGSEYGWRGSVQLQLDDIDIPIDIGEIDAGETASDASSSASTQGSTYEIEGDLLIGP